MSEKSNAMNGEPAVARARVYDTEGEAEMQALRLMEKTGIKYVLFTKGPGNFGFTSQREWNRRDGRGRNYRRFVATLIPEHIE